MSIKKPKTPKTPYTATKNACKLCTPLGACLAFKGIERAVPMLHGSQGCATYIRRYLISHFKEPVDIASSNFSEETAVFGGGNNLKTGLQNLSRQYQPEIIGIATTCLAETIGEDLNLILNDYQPADPAPRLVTVSTPSYTGTHMDGFHAAVLSTVEQLAQNGHDGRQHINLLSGMVSPADIRHLKDIMADMGLDYVLLPDYSETLDGSPWTEYSPLQPGGTSLQDIREMGQARASLEFGQTLSEQHSAGKLLEERFKVPCFSLGLPIGLQETDRLFDTLQHITGQDMPTRYDKARGRLIDAYVDGHKYVSQARAVVYGEEDLVVGLASFLCEIGVTPVLCASGGESGHMEAKIKAAAQDLPAIDEIVVYDGVDFIEIGDIATRMAPDFLIGSSKGYSIAKELDIPLVRVGFPIHDRFGGGRILHLGYDGAQQLFDRVVNAIIDKRQTDSGLGYAYM